MIGLLIIFMVIVLIMIIVNYAAVEVQTKQLNKHGLSFKTESFGQDSKKVYFFDSLNQEWITYLKYHIPIHLDDNMPRSPEMYEAFYNFMNGDLEDIIQSTKSIRQIQAHNIQVRSDYTFFKEIYLRRLEEFERKRDKY